MAAPMAARRAEQSESCDTHTAEDVPFTLDERAFAHGAHTWEAERQGGPNGRGAGGRGR